MGDVATAACGGERERKEAPRSTSAPRSKRAQCRAPQEADTLKKGSIPKSIKNKSTNQKG